MKSKLWIIAGVICTGAFLCEGQPGISMGAKPGQHMLQFTAGGHVLGFAPEALYVATGSHALRVEFAGATGVRPVADGTAAAESGKDAPLSRVRYAGLWEGVDLTYEVAAGGIARSTWRVAAGANPAQIRMRYNVPVEREEDGGLRLRFSTGWMNESAPVAWQVAEGRRVPVEVGFRVRDGMEVSFAVGAYDHGRELWIDPALQWNTFLGGASSDDLGSGIVVDGNGNVYVIGHAAAKWGSPLRAFSGYGDAFVAKLNSFGVLQWSTFLGSLGNDHGEDITVDINGNVYVTGHSSATWGRPVRDFTGVLADDAFVAKLNSSGALQWNTFLGSADDDSGRAISVDVGGNVYLTGESYAAWGNPIRAFSGSSDYPNAFVAKLNSSGALQWNTFLGSADADWGTGTAVDGSGNVYVSGLSLATWGNPVRACSGSDAFVAKLNGSGTLQWNTFLGSINTDEGFGIAVDGSGNVYVVGDSQTVWGSPIRAFSTSGPACEDAFLAKLNSSGALQWNTFLGSAADDRGNRIVLDGSGSIYVTGDSDATWEDPIRTFSVSAQNYGDTFVAKVNNAGAFQWNTFLGSADYDTGNGIALDRHGNIYVTGDSYAKWSSPVRAFSGPTGFPDAFVAKLSGDTSNSAVITVVANPSAGGTVSGGGTYAAGQAVQISATANSGYTFSQWNDDNKQNPRTIVVPSGGATYTATFTGSGNGLLGIYFDTIGFTTFKFKRTDATVNFNWGDGAPAADMGADTFSVFWTGDVMPQYSGTYTFYVNSDNGSRLRINNVLIVDNWGNHSLQEKSGQISLTAGSKYNIKLAYYERDQLASVQLSWSCAQQPKQIIPKTRLFLP